MKNNHHLGSKVGVPELVMVLCKLDLVEASLGVVVRVIHNAIIDLEKQFWFNIFRLSNIVKSNLLQSCGTLLLV